MVIFLDTSALVKLYYKEADSEALVKQVLSQPIEIYLSELSKVEFVSAMWKKIRTGHIDVSTGKQKITLFEEDHNQYQWISLDKILIDNASVLFEKYGVAGLRTLDALQLAAALHIKQQANNFLTADELLRSFFEQEGLLTDF